jgi:hypothetical protein
MSKVTNDLPATVTPIASAGPIAAAVASVIVPCAHGAMTRWTSNAPAADTVSAHNVTVAWTISLPVVPGGTIGARSNLTHVFSTELIRSVAAVPKFIFGCADEVNASRFGDAVTARDSPGRMIEIRPKAIVTAIRTPTAPLFVRKALLALDVVDIKLHLRD